MIISSTAIEGPAIVDPEPRSDDRASLLARSASRRFGAAGLQTVVEQCNLSGNCKAGTLHFQIAPHPEAKVVRCIRGAIVDVVVDGRPGSPTQLPHVPAELTAENRRRSTCLRTSRTRTRP
jgi:dTDP-4-dehydrorhamnose 3,5-epimerase